MTILFAGKTNIGRDGVFGFLRYIPFFMVAGEIVVLDFSAAITIAGEYRHDYC